MELHTENWKHRSWRTITWNIPANRPDFIGTVPIFDFLNLQKSGRPDFQEFQPVNIPVFKLVFKDINHIFLVFLLQIEKK